MDAMGALRRWRVGDDCTARVLDTIDLFSECTPKQLRSVARLFCPIRVECGRVLVSEGRRREQFILVVRGEAQVTVCGGSTGCLGPGEFGGAGAVTEEGIEPATVTATEPMDLLVATHEALRALVEIAPSLRPKLFPQTELETREVARAAAGASDGGRAA